MSYVSSGHSYLIQLPPEGNLNSVIKQSDGGKLLSYCSPCPSSCLSIILYFVVPGTVIGKIHSTN